MGAEHSHQRTDASDVQELFEDDLRTGIATTAGNVKTLQRRHANAAVGSGAIVVHKQILETASPTNSEQSRAPSPPLSVCSDLPYVSYTDRPIGDSPKIRNKTHNSERLNSRHQQQQQQHAKTGAKPKRPQSNVPSHSIVIVKPGARDNDDVDADLARLRNIPQFFPVLRESITSATFTRDPEVLERLQAEHFFNICNRMQMHLNISANTVAQEQNHLVERTKMVSNSITTLFASFVDMQKAYASYAEHFAKIRGISQQLNHCQELLNENIASLETINTFLDVEDRLEPFVWRTDDNKVRARAENEEAAASQKGRVVRRI